MSDSNETGQEHIRYEHNAKEPGNGLAIQDWNDLSSAVAGESGLSLALKSQYRVGIGTKEPKTKLHVDGDVTARKFIGDGSQLKNLPVRDTGGMILAADEGCVGIGTRETDESAKLDVNGVIRTKGLKLTKRDDHIEHDGALYRTGGGGEVYLTVDNNLYVRRQGHGTSMHFDVENKRLGIGCDDPSAPLTIAGIETQMDLSTEEEKHRHKWQNPDANMHISADCILFGGANRGRERDSASISAGKREKNSLNIFGMSQPGKSDDKWRTRKIDMWAEGGLAVRGNDNTWTVTMDGQKLYFALKTAYHGTQNSYGKMSWDGDANWDYASDVRLKTNIQPESQILPRLMQMPVKRYQWAKAGGQDREKIGFMAQDVQPLFPELVNTQTDSDTQQETLSLQYATFGVLAVGGLQELKAETDATIAAQTALIERLQERIAALEARLDS